MDSVGLEIEKKFLIFERGEDYSTEALGQLFPSILDLKDTVLRQGIKIRQGYVPIEIGNEIRGIHGLESVSGMSEARLRDFGGEYFLTMKSKGGLTRKETPDLKVSGTVFDLYWRYAERRLEKVRLERILGEHNFEIDVYTDRDLVVAEVEVRTEMYARRVIPLGPDITEDIGYKNNQLARLDFHRKFILTGGPCCGKTLTIGYLGQLQFPIVPESARPIIKEQERIGGKILPWEKFLEFQLEVLRDSLDLENSMKGEGTVFLDRGIPDALAYCLEAEKEPPTPLKDAIRDQNYREVFILDPLPYLSDDSRKESPEKAGELHRLLLETYKNLGHSPVSVPANLDLLKEESIRERAHFILGQSIN